MVQQEFLKFGTEFETDGTFWVDQLNKRAREIAQIDDSKYWEKIRQGTDVYMSRISMIPYVVFVVGILAVLRMFYFVGLLPSLAVGHFCFPRN
jgi:hypothetical protein